MTEKERCIKIRNLMERYDHDGNNVSSLPHGRVQPRQTKLLDHAHTMRMTWERCVTKERCVTSLNTAVGETTKTVIVTGPSIIVTITVAISSNKSNYTVI